MESEHTLQVGEKDRQLILRYRCHLLGRMGVAVARGEVCVSHWVPGPTCP